VRAAKQLYGVRIWIPPRDVLLQILEKEFVPLLVGMVRLYFLPAFSAKAQPWMNRLGNIVLTLGIIAMLWIMRATLTGLLTWWLPVGALLLALGSVAAIWLLVPKADLLTKRSLAICMQTDISGWRCCLVGQYLRLKGALACGGYVCRWWCLS
jgi:predicted Na+-dependent transporter